ncbi:MAG: hypothetical protein C4297_13965 [Gemmataceae bacterium]
MPTTCCGISLEAVEEDHALLEQQVRTLDQLLEVASQQAVPEEAVTQALEDLRRYFVRELLDHLRREEATFVPAVESYLPGGYWKAARIRRDHESLRASIDEFRTAFTLASYVGPETRQSLLWRLIREAQIILAQLEHHARFESSLVREFQKRPAEPSEKSGSASAE